MCDSGVLKGGQHFSKRTQTYLKIYGTGGGKALAPLFPRRIAIDREVKTWCFKVYSCLSKLATRFESKRFWLMTSNALEKDIGLRFTLTTHRKDEKFGTVSNWLELGLPKFTQDIDPSITKTLLEKQNVNCRLERLNSEN